MRKRPAETEEEKISYIQASKLFAREISEGDKRKNRLHREPNVAVEMSVWHCLTTL